MGAITQQTLNEALAKIESFMNQLSNSLADKMIGGTLFELKAHFLQRSMSYSYCFDLDFIVLGFENHEPIIRAIIEIKKENRPISENQKKVYLKIARALDVPAYLLIMKTHNKFQIKRFDKEENLGFFTYDELTKWFQNVSNGLFDKHHLAVTQTIKKFKEEKQIA